MTTTNNIEIKSSKSKLAKLFLFSVLFFVGGIWMVVANPQTSNAAFNNPVVKGLASYGCLLMGLFGIYFFAKKMVDKKPALIISEEGIIDNTSAFKFGLIPWADIVGIYESSVQASIASKQRFVTIALADPEKYISKESNWAKRKMLEANRKHYGSPVHISAGSMEKNHQELLQLLNEHFAKYRQ